MSPAGPHSPTRAGAIVAATLSLLATAGASAQARLPPPTSASGSAVGYEMAGAPIPESALESLPTQVERALAACATEAVPLIGQPIQARLTVAPAGITSAVQLEGEGGDPASRGCVERALGVLRFPARRRETTLVIELAFRPGAAAGAAAEDPRVVRYRASVVRAIETHQPAVHACFERSRRALESPDGRVLVELTIAEDGRVARAVIPSGQLFPQLAECLGRELPRWTVPRPPTAPFRMEHRLEGHVAAYGE